MENHGTAEWKWQTGRGAAAGDTLKDFSVEAIQRLHKLGLETVMIAGDNRHAAACGVLSPKAAWAILTR